MEFRETEKTELKEKLTDTFEKALVAFLNSMDGTIYIGVNDNGEVMGVHNIDAMQREIADIITTRILPNPQSFVEVGSICIDGKSVVTVKVKKGNALYYIKKYGRSAQGCYVRIGTSCRSMTEEEIERGFRASLTQADLIKSMPAGYTPLSFEQLKIYYSEKGFHLDDNTLAKNLDLLMPNGEYNKLAELLSDKNRISFIYARFHGKDKASFGETVDHGNECIITAVKRMITRLEAENFGMSTITPHGRKDKKLVDMDALKEAVYNAVTHNDWASGYVPAVYKFDDRFEIISHGGLPLGQTVDEFYMGISKPRSLSLMRIMRDLNIAESTGHGVPNIVRIYGKEAFRITDSYINVTLPFDEEVVKSLQLQTESQNVPVNVSVNVPVNKTEQLVFELIRQNSGITYDELAAKIGKTRKTVLRVIASLKNKGLIRRVGSDKSGYWEIIE